MDEKATIVVLPFLSPKVPTHTQVIPYYKNKFLCTDLTLTVISTIINYFILFRKLDDPIIVIE